MSMTPEQALEQAALAGIHQLAISTPFAVGKVNCYLIEDEPLTLVDTGPNSGKGLDELGARLSERGHSIDDIGLIIVAAPSAATSGWSRSWSSIRAPRWRRWGRRRTGSRDSTRTPSGRTSSRSK